MRQEPTLRPRPSMLLLAAILVACGSESIHPGESPEDYAARLAETHDHTYVLQRLEELPGNGEGVGEDALIWKGYTLLMEGKFDQSHVIQQVAVELFPFSSRAWENLGEVEIYLGQKEAAQASLERAMEVNPESDAHWMLSDLDGRLRSAAAETQVIATFEPGEQTGLLGPYFGQLLPGITPELFAPGIVSTKGGHEFSCTFSPDGTEFYFNRGPNIYVAYLRDGGWTSPALAPFNSDALDHEPFIPSGGQRLFFGSGRPREGVPDDQAYGIWVMEREETGWGEPEYLFPGMFVTTSDLGNAFVTDIFSGGPPGICVYHPTSDGYGPCEWIPGPVNDLGPAHPLIAPDESYLIFDSQDGLFISSRMGGQNWSEPSPIEEINALGAIMTAAFSPDGDFLFFYANHDIYWVSAELLDRYLSSNPSQ